MPIVFANPHIRSTGCITPMGWIWWIHKPPMLSQCCCSIQPKIRRASFIFLSYMYIFWLDMGSPTYIFLLYPGEKAGDYDT